MSTDCEFYTDAIVERAAGRLHGERAARLRAHLAECAACRETLEVVRAVRSAPLELPDGLETRVRAAVAEGIAGTDREAGGVDRAVPLARQADRPVRRARPGWRPWALPLAVAATLALAWAGLMQVAGPGGAPGGEVEATVEYDPYGAWPGSDGMVAGEPVLSQLSVEELEALLEEMES